MIFSVVQVAGVQQRKVTCAVVPRSDCPKVKRHASGWVEIVHPVRSVTCEYVERDGDGDPTGKILQRRLPWVITVTRIEPKVWVDEINEKTARECGYGSPAALRAEWGRRHRHQDLASLVRFELGDTRDRSLYMTSSDFYRWDIGDGHGGTGDYTSSPTRSLDGAPVLTGEEYETLGVAARQRDQRRRADAAKRIGTETLAQRVARLEDVKNGALADDVRQELRIIEQRTLRAERKVLADSSGE
jgi:hypothetical protein